MRNHFILPIFLVVGAAANPARAQDRIRLEPAERQADHARCAPADDNRAAAKAGRHRALLGFARGLADNLPMLGGRGANLNVITGIASQAAAGALEHQPGVQPDTLGNCQPS